MKINRKSLLLLMVLVAWQTLMAQPVPTHLVIRVKAKDASIFGPHHASKYGAVFVSVRDAVSGKLYAKGLLGPGPEDSASAKQGVVPGGKQDTAAKKTTGRFEAVIDIAEPTLVTAEVVAPTKKRNAAASTGADFTYPAGESVIASTQLWLIPGKDIDGDGQLIEIPGFILDILAPSGGRHLLLDTLAGGRLNVSVSLTMMCGCKITSGGRWNADNIEVAGYLKKNGSKVQATELRLSDTSRYRGIFTIRERGKYELTVTAYDRVTKNTGVDKIVFTVDSSGQRTNAVSANDFEKAVRAGGVQLLDVRRPDEFSAGHLLGAVRANWHDSTEFREQAAHLDKKKPVYVYCLSGGRSGKAADWLAQNGFTQVIDLEGGIKAWKAAGKPLSEPQ